MTSKLQKFLTFWIPVKGDRMLIELINREENRLNLSKKDINPDSLIGTVITAKYASYLGALYYGSKALF